jgi:hypothetical protein
MFELEEGWRAERELGKSRRVGRGVAFRLSDVILDGGHFSCVFDRLVYSLHAVLTIQLE